MGGCGEKGKCRRRGSVKVGGSARAEQRGEREEKAKITVPEESETLCHGRQARRGSQTPLASGKSRAGRARSEALAQFHAVVLTEEEEGGSVDTIEPHTAGHIHQHIAPGSPQGHWVESSHCGRSMDISSETQINTLRTSSPASLFLRRV
ncbi:hypothetical protein JZ751_003199 [Albula glossodonta]|uniref:Uncharacterized protein n=1 Tax=Albula glossodonta TaxID=121402 RepID=A0A8T2NDD6_9TELE|nr:hypothetical protein JZ751_003199 [Albula glossodonta]